ncbi:hypothetical protein PGDDIFCJ_00002 [Thermus phage YS40_Isch]|nr:hypothetical protein PGDDIFCJ_00002 [Thermus phage YS40_Isch]
MPKQIRTDLDFLNVSRIINLPDPVNDGDAVNKKYVDALIEGINWKDNVRAASTSNVDISSPGPALDGVTLNIGDRILLKDQTTQSENGIYIFNGPSSPLTRAPDANTAKELINAVVLVDEGTSNAGTVWRQTNVITNLGTDNVVFQPFFPSAPLATITTAGIIRIATQAEVDAGTTPDAAVTPLTLNNWSKAPKRYTATIGDTTNTVYTITHNLNTRDIHVSVYNNSGNYDDVEVEVRRPSVNSIEIRTSSPPGNNALRVVIIG